MRFPLHNMAYVMLAAATALPAQDAWSAWLSRLRDRTGPEAPWVLVLRTQDARGTWWMQDDGVRRLLATREFQVQAVADPAGRDLAQQRGWKQEPRWLLLSPDGDKQAEGQGRPGSERLLEALRGLGFVPRWERREAFLKEYPKHGPARLEAVLEAVRLFGLRLNAVPGGAEAMMKRLQATPRDPLAHGQLEAMFRELVEALPLFAQVPHWWEKEDFPLRRLTPRLDAELPAAFTEAIVRMREQLRAELEQDPGDDNLWELWSGYARATGQEARTILDSALPAPGQAWPPENLVSSLADGHVASGDWAGMLRTMNALKATATRLPADADAWDATRYALALLEIQRARALARLDRWEESAGAVGEARFLAGQRWRGFLASFLRRGIPQAYGERQSIYEPFLEGDPLPDPPMPPAAPRLRLLRLGAPAWAAAWAALPRTPELAPWGPNELVYEPAPAERELGLRAQHGWSGPRWALLAGQDLLASGDAPPAARDLAARLADLPSRLQRLDRFIERHPRHRAARRLRLELLRARMPNPHLEPQLAEDARLLKARVKADPTWTPEPGLWQWSAEQVLPDLEADLEHWPDRAETWRAWLAWAKLHPREPSVVLLARRLPLWGVEASWSSRLPAEVHKAVAAELREGGRFEDLRQWFQAAWDGLDKQARRRGPAPTWLRTLRRAQKEAIVDPLREALITLRRDDDLLTLDREVAVWLGEEGGTR